jgi:hypothetical protein
MLHQVRAHYLLKASTLDAAPESLSILNPGLCLSFAIEGHRIVYCSPRGRIRWYGYSHRHLEVATLYWHRARWFAKQ